MADVNNLITENIDVWTSAIKKRNATGRGSSKKIELTGIKKLRELILELAVRGKLVPQDVNDEPVEVLLEKLAEIKQKLISDKILKKTRKQPEISQEDKSHELPLGWAWARLEDVYDVRDGTHDSPKAQLTGYPLVTSKNLSSGKLDLSDIKYISEADHAKVIARSKVDRDDILFAMIGSIGNPVIVDLEPDFSIKNLGLFKYFDRELSSPNYLKYFLFYASVIMKSQSAGGVQPFVSLGKLRSFCISLPPLVEQHRIVAKVDELMVLCDELEQQTEQSLTAHQTLVETLLATLVDAKPNTLSTQNSGSSSVPVSSAPNSVTTNAEDCTANDFQENWQRIADHFDTLFTTESSIESLKQTILQLAVMGKLVPQNPSDEPASVLLEKIAIEKAQLIADKKIKKQKPLPAITDEEKPFELPSSWECARLGYLINLVSGQHLKPSEYSEDELETGVPYITGPAEFGENHPLYSKYTIERRALANSGDILITCKGAGLGKLNRANITIAISRQLMAIQPILVEVDYIYLVVNSSYDYFQDRGVGIAIPGMSREDVTELITLLPPIAEQHRIVAKVDELMAICDQLKARLSDAQTTQVHLADAVVENALKGER